MPLTLGNDLTRIVSNNVDSHLRKINANSRSMVVGENQSNTVVNSLLGNSLRNKELTFNALLKNSAYGINAVKIIENAYDSITSLLTQGMKAVISANLVSGDKVLVFQRYVDGIKSQINNIINNTNFDNRQLLGAQTNEIKIQTGLEPNDQVSILVRNISGDRLYRTTVTNALNDWIAADPTGARTSYYTQAQLAAAIRDNENLISYGAYGAGGLGTLGNPMTEAEIAAAIVAVRNDQPELIAELEGFVPIFMTQLGGVSLNVATALQITNALSGVPNIPGQFELFDFFKDSIQINLNTDINKQIAFDIFRAALVVIGKEKANILNIESNLTSSVDALSAQRNVSKEAADSFLETDYLVTSQKFAELIKQIMASLAALQAAEKKADALQLLVENISK